jgi:hypothetical protein
VPDYTNAPLKHLKTCSLGAKTKMKKLTFFQKIKKKFFGIV